MFLSFTVIYSEKTQILKKKFCLFRFAFTMTDYFLSVSSFATFAMTIFPMILLGSSSGLWFCFSLPSFYCFTSFLSESYVLACLSSFSKKVKGLVASFQKFLHLGLLVIAFFFCFCAYDLVII